MGTFALVSEGPTDHAILKNILLGYFEGLLSSQDIVRVHPDASSFDPVGWTALMAYLRDKEFRSAFQNNEYVVVQVDTDVSEEKGFDVPKQNDAGPLSLEALVDSVRVRLQAEIGSGDWVTYGSRFIFAIAVGEIECWVLPLWEKHDSRSAKTTGCLKALGEALRENGHSWMQKGHKKFDDYDYASKKYLKRKTLMERGIKNPSLKLFIEDLDRRNFSPPKAE